MKTTFLLLSILIVSAITQAGEKAKPLLQEVQSSTKFIINNVSVFDGVNKNILKRRHVIVEDGIIISVAENIDTINLLEWKKIDGTNLFLMPGLVDAHVHLSGNGAVPWQKVKSTPKQNLVAYLYCGITTIYDLGGLSKEMEKYKAKILGGKLIGPSIYHTHIPITVEDSHPIPITQQILGWPLRGLVNKITPTVDDTSKIADLIDKYAKNKVDFIKLISDQIPPETPEMDLIRIRKVVENSKRHNLKVIAHVGSPENAMNAIDAGVDILAHTVWRGRLTSAEAKRIVNAKVPIITTVAGFINVASIYNGKFKPSEIDKLLIHPDALGAVSYSNGTRVKENEVMAAFFKDVSENIENLKYNIQLLRSLGARFALGTDSVLPGTYAGCTYYQEMDELKNLGFSNFDILKAGTSAAAELFLDNPDFGSIEKGKKANFLLLESNPIENLDAVKTPQLIFCNGKIFTRTIK